MSDMLGKVLYHFSAPAELAVNSIDISDDGKLLVIAQESGKEDSPTLSVIDIESGKCLKVIERTTQGSNGIYKVLFDRDGSQLIYVSQADSGFKLCTFNLSSEESKVLDTCGNPSMQHGLTLDRSGEQLLVAGYPVKLWDLKRRKQIESIPINMDSESDKVVSSAISPDGTVIAIGGQKEGIVELYDISSHHVSKQYSGGFTTVQELEFDSAGKYLAAVDFYGNGVFVWNASSGERYLAEIFNEETALTWCIGFSYQESYLALGHIRSYVALYDLDSGEELFADKLHHGRVYDICFSYDGKFLISGGEDGKIFVRSLL